MSVRKQTLVVIAAALLLAACGLEVDAARPEVGSYVGQLGGGRVSVYCDGTTRIYAYQGVAAVPGGCQ